MALEPRNVSEAMLRGLTLRCPSCGQGKLYRGYLKVVDSCPSCGQEMHHHRADDAPPYFTIVIVGHIVVPVVLVIERMFAPALWLQAVGWTAIIVAMCMILLPSVKGALVGLQWANYMHGFDPRSDGREDWDGLDPERYAPAKLET
ncbi:DUF983 domain-containing protein [Microbaculum marinum]|uniref:DUF983 domain-containing protein n=1 Tax=Microbaculum marinum TaxID=1764581 RepID=A0AAW9RZU1_9HYPH